MLKKLFSFSQLLVLSCATLGTCSLTSCGSGATEEDQQYAGYMSLEDFASGRNSFFIRNAFYRFFFIRSDGGGNVGEPNSTNEIIVTGHIDVDSNIYPVTMVYRTNEHSTPSGLATQGTLEITLNDPLDAIDFTLITAVFRDLGAPGDYLITGEPITLSFEFDSGLGIMKCTVATDFVYRSDDGNWIISGDTSEEAQNIGVSVLKSTVAPDLSGN